MCDPFCAPFVTLCLTPFALLLLLSFAPQEEFAAEEKDVMRARIERRLALIDVSPEVKQELKQQLDELRSI